MQPYYSDLLEQACQRSKESTLSVLGINDPELENTLLNKCLSFREANLHF